MAKKKNPIKDLAIFGIGMGILFGVGAFYALTGLKNAPDLNGMDRYLIIGLPLLFMSISHLLSGIAIIKTKSNWSILCTAISSWVATTFYFLFEINTIGFFNAKFVSLIAYAMPVIVFISMNKALIQFEQIKYDQEYASEKIKDKP